MGVEVLLLVLVLGILLISALTAIPFRPEAYIFLGVSCVLLSLAQLPESLTIVANLSRLLACFWLAIAIMRQKSGRQGVIILGQNRQDFLASITPFAVIFICYLVLNITLMVVHGSEFSAVVEELTGPILGYLFVMLLLGCRFFINSQVKLAMAFFLASSLLMGFLIPEVAIIQNRLAGVFANANGTATVATALVATVGIKRKISVADWVLIAMAFATILWTASRTSAAIAVFFAVALVVQQRSWGTRILLWSYGLIAGIFGSWLIATNASDVLLFRNTQSRHAWSWAIEQLRESPFIGYGYVMGPNGREIASEVGSSFLTMAVLGGTFGLALLTLICVVLAFIAVKSGYNAIMVLCGFLLHSIFESWLVAPGSPVMLVFLCVFVAAVQADHAVRIRSAMGNNLGESLLQVSSVDVMGHGPAQTAS